MDVAKKGQEVCVKIEPIPGESPKMYGRHFEATDILVSKASISLSWSAPPPLHLSRAALHMEVPRLGVESELQPPAYTTATATRDLS